MARRSDDSNRASVPLESTVKRKCDKMIAMRNGYVIQVNADERGRKGAPDRVYCYRGRFIAVEYKRSEKEKPTPLQLEHRRQIFNAGGCWMLVWDHKQLESLLDNFDRIEGIGKE